MSVNSTMATPVPLPPGTPTPPSDEERILPATGLGLEGVGLQHTSSILDDNGSLSPTNDIISSRQLGSISSVIPTPATTFTPATPTDLSPTVEEGQEGDGIASDSAQQIRNPFGFQPTTYQALKSPARSVGQRRGHKYKHSSVSHQIFLEPEPRAPLRLPASLPVPTSREGWKSMSREQTLRVSWCFCHLFVAAYVQWTAQGSLSLTALSHLIFYDAIGAFLCAGVEVLSNFEVWKRSSIRQPFGLERSEVLVGFANSILLLFMGFDLISHNLSHILAAADSGVHEQHRPHRHERVSATSVDLVSLLAVASTLISALMLQNHARIARSLRMASISFLPSILSNPSHLLTISCSAILLLMPFLSYELYTLIDRTLSTAMACAMCFLGGLLVKNLGAMLLMSYNGPGVVEMLSELEREPNVSSIVEAKFWQVHYGLCMANLKLRVKGTEEQILRLREHVQSLIKARLGLPYDGIGAAQVWEVSTQMTLEKD
ncbi:hypothetical protein FH972_021914 [Carpinus fangiana]|uniref:Cation efflux protein transmembrane domain-containing protein n=1 Tax=Carpinus fangiana TaxID=176857 RepID=A0A5N6KQQ5_9ROSI|nr:hypothetical protein FH972_021914 [Carpinus fangiana]